MIWFKTTYLHFLSLYILQELFVLDKILQTEAVVGILSQPDPLARLSLELDHIGSLAKGLTVVSEAIVACEICVLSQ